MHEQRGSALKDRIVTIAAVGLAAVVIAVIVTWVLWPRESTVVSSGQTVRGSQPTSVTDFDVCKPGWQVGHRGALSFSGRLVVWTVDTAAGSRLMAVDIRVHKPFLLLRGTKDVSMRQPVLAGSTLVWRQHRSSDPLHAASLWSMDVRARKARQISRPAVIDGYDVSQGKVVWLERTGPRDAPEDSIYLCDAAGGQRREVPAVKGPKSDVAYGQGMVAWSADQKGQPDVGVWVYDPMGHTAVRVSSQRARSVDISGSYVVWVDTQGAVRSLDLNSGKRQVLSYGNGMARECRVDGPLAVWWDASAIGDTVLMKVGDVYAADLRSDRRFPISTLGSAQETPQVSGLTVVWPDDSRGLWIIRGAEVSL